MLASTNGVFPLSQSPLDFLNLFVRSPGDILYFLAVIALSQAALFLALSERWRQPAIPDSRRFSLALGGVVAAWVIILAGSLFSLISGQKIAAILPPLERAASVVVIVLISWAFLPADNQPLARRLNFLFIIVLVLLASGYLVSGVQWAGAADQSNFNLTPLGTVWTFVGLALSLMGLLLSLALFRFTPDAPLKLLFFMLPIMGYAGTLLQITQANIIGNDAGAIRLSLLAAMALLPLIMYRMVLSHWQVDLRIASSMAGNGTFTQSSTPIAEPHPVSAPNTLPQVSPIQRDSIQLLKTLGLILEEASPSTIPDRIVQSGIEVLKAEVGALLNLQDANYADVTAAYDREQQRPLSGMALNLDNQPTLVNAIERRLQRPLYADRNMDELRDLYNRLDIEHFGSTYFQPLMSGKELIAVLMVGNPYSGRELEESERELLKGVGVISGNLLALSYAARDSRFQAEERAIEALVQGVPMDTVTDNRVLAARQEMQANLQAARDQISNLSTQVAKLKTDLDSERGRVTIALGDTQEGLSVSQRILALTDDHQKLREERENLQARLQQAETALAGATATRNDNIYRSMIESLRREKDDLLNQRDSLQVQLSELRAGTLFTSPNAVVVHMDQERAHLEDERNQLEARLNDIENQLRTFGIENGPAGLTQLIQHLTQQRFDLQSQLDSALLERDALLNERSQVSNSANAEKERATRMQAIETEIRNISSDREALLKERDQLRAERDMLFAKQDALKQHRARLMAEASAYQMELDESHQELAKLRQELQQTQAEKSNLTAEQNRLQAEKQALTTERDLLLARTDGDRSRLQDMGEKGVGSLTRMIEDLSAQRSQLEQELTSVQGQLATTQNQMDALNLRSQAQAANAETHYQNYDPELILGMVQELRTPITSVIGYIDLLMDESAGILGEMQRKFLQRVAANISRMALQLDDITRMAAIDRSRYVLVQESLDVINLIEDAINTTAYQFREKGLTVRLRLDDNLPEIRADRDALTQMIGELLNNAYIVSPQDSPVIISAHRQDVQLSQHANLSRATDCILISVEDRGGGIPQDDLARVFARKYKAENPLVQGLGDTGVGLSLAKTLAEAHGGGLWVETRPEIGSIFHVALPITSETQEAKEA